MFFLIHEGFLTVFGTAVTCAAAVLLAMCAIPPWVCFVEWLETKREAPAQPKNRS